MTRRLPWGRVVAEGAVIVASILLAFGIEAWWSGRNEIRAIETALENISFEVEIGFQDLTAALDDNRARIAVFREFLGLDPARVRELTEDSLYAIAWSFLPPRTFDGGGSTLLGVLEGGNLDLIEDVETRAALVEWGRFPDEIDEDYVNTRSVAQTVQDLAARRGMYVATGGQDRGAPYPGARSLRVTMGELREDEEFVGVLAQLAEEYVYFVSELERGLAPAERVLAAIANR